MPGSALLQRYTLGQVWSAEGGEGLWQAAAQRGVERPYILPPSSLQTLVGKAQDLLLKTSQRFVFGEGVWKERRKEEEEEAEPLPEQQLLES